MIRVFRVKKLTYIWDEKENKFMRLIGLDKGVKNSDFHRFSGFSDMEQALRYIYNYYKLKKKFENICFRRKIYGNNEISIPVQSILTLLVLEALNPFYIFQIFTLGVWLAEYYYYYTIAIVIMSVCGISSSIIQTRKVRKPGRKKILN